MKKSTPYLNNIHQSTEKIKVVCINNTNPKRNLTIGKVYEATIITNRTTKGQFYKIKDDNSQYLWRNKNTFTTQENWRQSQLNQLGL